MLRKAFRPFLLPGGLAAGLLLAAGAGRGQNPTAAEPATLPAQMWAATAHYLYHDDPGLLPIASQLDATVQETSLPAFNAGLAKAVELEKQLKGQQSLAKFQRIATELQSQNLDWGTLAATIVDRLDDNKQRMADPARKQGLQQLKEKLSVLAMATSVAPAAGVALAADSTAAPVPAASVPVVAAPPVAPGVLPGPAPTPWYQWLALTLAALGLGGVALLWRKHQRLANAFRRYQDKHHRSEGAVAPELSEQLKQEIARQLHARQQRDSAPAAAKALATVAPAVAAVSAPPAAVPAPPAAPAAPELPAAVPAPHVHTQYVNAAPLGNLFPASSLSEQPGQHSIFAIDYSDSQPNTGYFQVTGNQASHVRDHRSILEPVCQYAARPQGHEARISTLEAGQVARQPDGSWQVTQPARIRFDA